MAFENVTGVLHIGNYAAYFGHITSLPADIEALFDFEHTDVMSVTGIDSGRVVAAAANLCWFEQAENCPAGVIAL